MRYSLRLTFLFLLSAALLPLISAAQDIPEQAKAYLQTLSPELREATLFSLEDEERFNMNFVPAMRKGPRFHDFNPQQKNAALNLLEASLSPEGFRKATDIIKLEEVLALVENNGQKMPDGKPYRDPLNYHFSIFGNPDESAFWGWRFEGHHISLNFMLTGGNMVSGTPFFFGSNPGIVRIEKDKGKEVLKKETKLGFAMLHSLSPEQLKKTRFSETAPHEIITGNERKIRGLEIKGISFAELTAAQKGIFMELLEVYIGNYIFEFSETFRERIEQAGREALHFGWAGSLEEGAAHYYRIQGPMLLIEYDNTQNNANHVHTVIRDLENDFAEDLLRAHYTKKH